ncbi:cobalt ECF transporter T component CbiQ [Pseudobacteroides cellulosolvens]|uniref:Cobalt ABC transporter, inner membrane subunit CbiQ n=1 Tax=Pseudobacteroides cellulosolvens ATCC 35603 = DSM 2933 TaxID=398512 RepID=A0A0L6JQ99_9FIRM|nr:cobalt ECF transporter T component CbiQ [Pseudobacteroides cellulosolvens]KNY28016.1 cobalt ABC transporter, inner membrane subunit CbiQ [Pseudobacteroides cellulosolvens ATCC 35603 = DSM 2933]
MINIDKYAYNSKLKKVSVIRKLLFSLFALGICIWADSIAISVFIALIMILVTYKKGEVPLGFILKLMLVPFVFLLMSTLAITIEITRPENLSERMFILSGSIAGLQIGATIEGIKDALNIFFKALGTISCLYFLSLSTPMLELMAVLRKLKVPKLLIELMGLTYRFIFILLETAENIFVSQRARLGYEGLSSGFRSVKILFSSLFIRSFKRSDEIYRSLEARGYDGELNFLEEEIRFCCKDVINPAMFAFLMVLLTLSLKE